MTEALNHPEQTRNTTMRVIMLTICLLASLSCAAHADDDIAAARTIISSQADAFGRDDDAAAFAFAAPELQEMFQQPATFMAMVKRSYAPVYRHKSFEFGEARAMDGKIMQNVHIRDADGELWEALYTLERQPDGSLRITGCTLLKMAGA